MPTQTSERDVKTLCSEHLFALIKSIFSISSPGLWEFLTVIKNNPACKLENIASGPFSTMPTANKSGIGVQQQNQYQIQKVIIHRDQGTVNTDPKKKVLKFLLKLYGEAALNSLAVLINDKVIWFYGNRCYIHQRTRLQ